MSLFKMLTPLAQKASRSRGWLLVLNLVLGRVIPFNRPHGFSIAKIGEGVVHTRARYRKKNFNHIRGIHACAIATVAEFSAGFLLLTSLDPARFRLIMSKLEVEYTYQAKMDVISESNLSADQLERDVLQPLKEMEQVSIQVESRVRDTAGNEIARALTTWQIKRWDRVRTKV